MIKLYPINSYRSVNMIYNIYSVISAISNMDFLNHPDFANKEEFMTSCSFEHLFSHKVIKSICIFKKSIHIGSDSVNLFLSYINNKFNSSINIKQLNPYATTSTYRLEFIYLDSFDSFESLIKTLHKNEVDKSSKFKRLFRSPLPLNFTDKRLLSLDFEYVQMKEEVKIFEMGISISYNNEVSHFHYLINDQKKKPKPFNFGESIFVNKEDFFHILESHLSEVDYIVGHSLISDYKILEYNSFNLSKLDNISFIDTAGVIFNDFNIVINGKRQNTLLSLSNSLNLFGVEHTNLHNAGNDAAYSLELAHSILTRKNKYFASGVTTARIPLNI